MYRRKKRFTWRQIWQYRYRAYALIIVLILGPILFASGQDITPNIQLPSDQYQVLAHNFFYTEYIKQTPTNSGTEVAKVVIKDGQTQYLDKTGQVITDLLKQAGFDAGYISTQPFIDLGIPLPVKEQVVIDTGQSSSSSAPQQPTQKTLQDLVKKPSSPQYTNFLRYPKYNINVPIIYSTFQDLFQTNPDGSINFSKPVDNNPIDSPIQKKLRDGVVQLAFTPQPGEIGNSYIVGHSSNFSVVKSNYNSIFKPLESKSKVGEEFIIYDRDGRELKFKVFEVTKISEDDVQQAYKSFPDRRVVTLQTSILTWVGGQLKPTHRWLTRGELVV